MFTVHDLLLIACQQLAGISETGKDRVGQLYVILLDATIISEQMIAI